MGAADKGSSENQGKKKRRGVRNTANSTEAPPAVQKKNEEEKQIEEAGLVSVITANSSSLGDSGIEVSMFDSSAENHFRAMDTIYKLCGEGNTGGFDDDEIERLSSTITFLSEWRYFNYRPKILRFMPETGFSNGKEAQNDITLCQYSAASVPKYDMEAEKVSASVVSAETRKDFVLYVGGLVWALDWCPRPERGTHSDIKCEFIAVAAHPPNSAYHRLGAPLNGQGMIQIWCLVNCSSSEVDSRAPDGKTTRKYQKKAVAQKDADTLKKPRGRPRKNLVDKSPAHVDPAMQFSRAVVQLPENTSDMPLLEENILNTLPSQNMPAAVDNVEQKSEKQDGTKEGNKPKKPRGRPRKNAPDETPAVAGTERWLIQALPVPHSGDSTNVHPLDDNKLISPSRQKEKRKKQKDVTIRSNATDNAADILDTEGQCGQALIVQPTEGTSNVSLVDEDLLIYPASQEQKEEKQKGLKMRKNALDKTPAIAHTEGPFTQALVLHLSERTSNMPPVDKNMLTTPAHPKEQRRKRKAISSRKNGVAEIADAPDSEEPLFQALAVEFPEDMPKIFSSEDHIVYSPAPQKNFGKRRRVPTKKALNADLECTISELRRRSRGKSKVRNEPCHDVRLTQNEGEGPSLLGQEKNNSEKGDIVLEDHVAGDGLSHLASGGGYVPKNVVLPRVVLCLGHDGKVAWDVKWRPHNASGSADKHIIGYLAVVLGNGSVEVWEIPSPQVIQRIYASQHGEGIDPRFAKLKPIFKCSKLKCGETQSMPLTVEWSASPPHDLILAGCHDGMVALWKFSPNGSSQDVRPLLCFRAETVPIRALSWAPYEGDIENVNVIVTAGHGGLKFWDLRDPFRPLWDANPSQRFIYGLDWLPDPRCVLVSYDDGTLRMVSLSRAAYDVPVTGEPFTGTLQQGVHSYCCSSSAIWSIHVSRLTGMVAYCCADGTVLYFQLTHKAVDKDPLRNRVPHFLCGSFVDEKSVIAVNTDLPTSPHLMKKSATEWANTPRPARSVASGLNQAKRVKKGMEKNDKTDEVLALSYGDDNIKGDTNEVQTSSPKRKGKTGKLKKANNDQVLISIDENGRTMNGEPDVKEEVDGEIEDPPSKIVSMYKVRWNMNNGSERWVCYGGAAGIVRCQEIVAPLFDKKLLRRGPS